MPRSFAWSGPTTVAAGENGTTHYRIQGLTLVIEYAPQSIGGDASMRVHPMYRDPTAALIALMHSLAPTRSPPAVRDA